MIPTNPRLSPSEIVMIELMKLDQNFDHYHEDVDMSVPFDVRESYEAAPERYLPRLLAERARLYCFKKMDMPVDDIQSKWVRLATWLTVFTVGSFLCLATLTALGVPAMFFSGEKREASVLAVSVLIGVMALPCILPLMSLVSLIGQRLMGRPQAVVADAILWIIRACRDGWASMRGLPLPSQQAESTRFQELFRRNSYFASASTIFLSNLYFVLMGIAIWGVLWLFLFSRNVNYVHESSLSTAEERASFIESASKPVKFITGTPAPGPDEMRWAADPEHFVFDERDFVREVDGVAQPWGRDEITTHKRNTIESFRRAWSRFLLSSVWTWVFLPRAAVAIVACASMLWFYGDFRPNHADPKNRRIVEHVRKRHSQVEEVPVEQVAPMPPTSAHDAQMSKDPAIDINSADLEDSSAQAIGDQTNTGNRLSNPTFDLAPVIPSAERKTIHEPKHVGHKDARIEDFVKPRDVDRAESPKHKNTGKSSEAPKASRAYRDDLPVSAPAIAPTKVAPSTALDVKPERIPEAVPPSYPACLESLSVVGFGLGKNGNESIERLVRLGRNSNDRGNLNGAREQLRFRSTWKADGRADSTLVIIVSLTSVPTVSFGEFLSDLVAYAQSKAPGAQPSIKIILTDGKDTRRRLAQDADVFETRVSQWIGRIVGSGLDKSNVIEFDISSDEGAMAAWHALMPTARSTASGQLNIAGKTKDAVNVVRKHFTDALSLEKETRIPSDWNKHLSVISSDLGSLYKEEKAKLLHLLNSMNCSEKVRAAIDSCELPSGVVPEELQTLAKSLELFKSVSPKWIGAGAMGGLGLGAIVGISVLVSGGFAAVPLIAPTLISSALGGAIAGQLAKTFRLKTWLQGAAPQEEPANEIGISAAAEQTLQASLLQIIVLELQGNSESEITRQLREQTIRLEHHNVRNEVDIENLLRDFQEGMLAMGGLSNGI